MNMSENAMHKPKLLIIDDDPGIRTQLKWGLEGYDVITAESRSDAIEQINQFHPPLVTLDLGLPPDADGTNEGFAILKEIMQKAPETKVVVVSGSQGSNNAEKARNNGAYEYFPKPVEIEQLQQTMEKAYIEYEMADRLS
ncbi:MAG TPA: response regulator [Gammaproteobacteria bacterium]|nr:response regulator [Gammaproteobacteria bacterium]